MPEHKKHFWAAGAFLLLAAVSLFLRSRGSGWPFMALLSALAALLAWIRGRRWRLIQVEDEPAGDSPEGVSDLPDGQAKLIDSGQLPNRLHPELDLRLSETAHFYVSAHWVLFKTFPEALQKELSRARIRLNRGRYFYILKPYDLLLPSHLDASIPGQLIITNQRVVFLSQEKGFEVPLDQIEHLDCSPALVDFQVQSRRYTVQTQAAAYAEKIFSLLDQAP